MENAHVQEVEEELVVVRSSRESAVIDSRRLGMAIAHVSAQTNVLADQHELLQLCQDQQAHEQQYYVDTSVQYLRAEAEARSNELASVIFQTRADPGAIAQHIDTQLRAALTVARDEVRAESRDVAAESARMQQETERRFQAALNELEKDVSEQSEQRTKELLTAYFRHYKEKTDASIKDQVHEAALVTQHQLHSLEQKMEASMEHVVKAAEKKSRSAVRRHLASDNLAREAALEARLSSALAEIESKAIAHAETRAEAIVGRFRNRQLTDAALFRPPGIEVREEDAEEEVTGAAPLKIAKDTDEDSSSDTEVWTMSPLRDTSTSSNHMARSDRPSGQCTTRKSCI